MSKPKSEKIRTAFSQMTLVMTLAFGLVTTLTLIEAPSRSLTIEGSSAGVARGIASVDSGDSLGVSAKPFMSTVEVDCKDAVDMTTGSEHVRLKGTLCGGRGGADVRNTSNGFVATVFHQGQSTFTTDYISLAKGQNDIVIEERLPSGKTSQRTLRVLRE